MKKIPLYLCSFLLTSFSYADSPQIQNKDLKYFLDTSFIYWYGKEDGMDLARNAVLAPLGNNFYAPHGKTLKQSFAYNPGFKIGTGAKTERWECKAEYTWLQSIAHTSKDAPSNNSIIEGTGVWSPSDWFLQLSSFNQPPVSRSISSDVHIGLNLLDLLGTHSLYSGKKLNVSGSIGLLGTYIHQRVNVYMPDAVTIITVPTGRLFIPPKDISSHNHSNAWGVGPKAGFNTNYLFGHGIRVQGGLSASLLYMKYTSVYHEESLVFEFSPENPLSDLLSQPSMTLSSSPYSTLRPVLEANLGLGWSWKFSQDKYLLDLSATYDFSYFWSQNAIRNMLDEYSTGAGSTPGDLYFEGITLTAGFSF